MITLLLLRHAHALRGGASNDHERPLDDLGRRQALLVGEFLSQAGFRPDRVLCSTALRARQTWEIVAGRLDGGLEAEFRDGLYLGTPEALLAELRALKEAQNVLLLAHNPTLQQLASSLTGYAEGELLSRLAADLPPAGLVRLTFAGAQWSELAPNGGRLTHFIEPASLI